MSVYLTGSLVGFIVGVCVMGGVWALYHNWKNHPDKLEAQFEDLKKRLGK